MHAYLPIISHPHKKTVCHDNSSNYWAKYAGTRDHHRNRISLAGTKCNQSLLYARSRYSQSLFLTRTRYGQSTLSDWTRCGYVFY